MTRFISLVAAAITLGAAMGSATAAPELAVPLGELSHIHGVEFEKSTGALLFATHHGGFHFEPETGGQPAGREAAISGETPTFPLTSGAVASGW